MPLRDLKIEIEYRSLKQDIAREFIVPSLCESKQYDRAVGFFSSTVLASISYGIENLAKNGGSIRLVASPILSEEDFEAIKEGYKRREECIKDAIISNMQTPKNTFENERLNLLANMIADGILSMKIAVCENVGSIGLYHEKLGIISDDLGDMIVFSGSMNETNTALNLNYETIDVFRSWENEYEKERAKVKKSAFLSIWNNNESGIDIIEFPELSDEFIKKYLREKIDYNSFQTRFPPMLSDMRKRKVMPHLPCRPLDLSLYDYQEEAIQKWVENSYNGIFDMATGTGKTLTGLGAITRLSDDLNGKLAVIIVCPYQHLVEQWVEDIEKFNIKPIIGYSQSPQKNWLRALENAIRNQKIQVKEKEFFCFICTNATYALEKTQNVLNRIYGNCLLVVDEAHNFGAAYLSKLLNPNFRYRLALSATLKRHGDSEGTRKLYDYFGEKCISYDLERAIYEGKLTRYKYYPIIVSLTLDELENYIALTKALRKCLEKTKSGKTRLTAKGKILAMKRARIVAGAENKIETLRQHIAGYTDKYHILVYCGATSLHDYTKENSEIAEDDVRQIEAVTDLLGNGLGMKIARFTSSEDMEQREVLKREFMNGDNLQALVAIKCLDEGVNIPSITTAFILASTTNPKEYIQRRGRVLRLAPGKKYAEIFDFITLPTYLGSAYYLSDEERKNSLAMVKNEIARAHEFARLADNYLESTKVLDEIREEYDLPEDFGYDEEFDYDE